VVVGAVAEAADLVRRTRIDGRRRRRLWDTTCVGERRKVDKNVDRVSYRCSFGLARPRGVPQVSLYFF
jgi:hypothetical protein